MFLTRSPQAEVAPTPDGVTDVVADFAAAVHAWPQRSAMVHNGRAITYQELAARASLMAMHCRARQIGTTARPGFVAVLVAHTPDTVERLLGILQAGCVYCPIDASLPTARKEAIAAVLGVDQLIAATREPHESTRLRIETFDDQYPATVVADPVPSQCHGRDPAYVLCTSGSTGTPKPVVVSRRALSVTVRALRDRFALTTEDRVLQFASLGWDTCFEEILPALTAGASVVFDDAAYSGSLPAFVRLLAERDITVLDLPTAFWHELVLYLHEESAKLPDSVRLLVIGGERVDPTRLNQWRQLGLEHVKLLNTYGCTETTMVTHAVQLSGTGTEPAIADLADAPLGSPLPHVRDHVADDGELLVSGPSLATGYLGMPSLTSTGFPIATHGFPAARWFRTGDLVVRGERNLLFGRGRADEQVKVRGVRVHPAEVEAQLNTHPAVAGSVVIGERRLAQMSLTAYVVRASDIAPAELRKYLHERLPSQFLPSRIEFVEKLAYTSSGKLDRAATRAAAVKDHSEGAE